MSHFIKYFDKAHDLIESWVKYSQAENYSIVYLTGGVLPESGKSWCSPCEAAKPYV
jgi:hypothetical protein